MTATRLLLYAAAVFLVVFAGLTVAVLLLSGPSIGAVLSLLILAMVGFGVVGALRQPPTA